MNTKRTVLGIDTSQKMASVSVFRDGQELVSGRCEPGESVSVGLGRLVAETLGNCDVSRAELAGVVVSTGPGSATGLRIGISFARGLADALGIVCTERPLLDVLHRELSEDGQRPVSAVYAGADTVVFRVGMTEGSGESLATERWLDRAVSELCGSRFVLTSDLAERIRGAGNRGVAFLEGDVSVVSDTARLLVDWE
ncbi:MAG: tRNA (adenosine(37)-N6)-threonylcarbamoyltransferase complex dimerization subunit type 1 TsaB [Acidobacteria bacterium]|nr:tRNA (adenosine(37)-N6)-threonylcarbamoyltransferase complex dimerization subunit type 1 TsaB [Acidobacteriota bacterium]